MADESLKQHLGLFLIVETGWFLNHEWVYSYRRGCLILFHIEYLKWFVSGAAPIPKKRRD